MNTQNTKATVILPGTFSGGDIEPGTFHGGDIEPGTFHATSPLEVDSADAVHSVKGTNE